MGWASCQHPGRRCGELETGGSGHSGQPCPPAPGDAALGPLYWPKDVPTALLWPSPFFSFIFIYLLTFMKFPFHPIPIAHVVPPAIQLSVQLSVCHKENKNSKQQDLRVVYGERWLGCRVLGQEHSSLLWASESPGIPASTFEPVCPLP